MLCPKCSYDNEDSNIRCEKCGEELIDKNQVENPNLNPSFNINENPIQEFKIDSFAEIFSGIGSAIMGAIFSIFSSMLVFEGADTTTKISGIPFLICGIAVLIHGILMIIKGINKKKNTDDYINGKLDMNKVEKSEKDFKKLGNIVNNIYIFGFLLFWFGFLIIFDIISIKSWSDGGSTMFFLSLIFWAAGIYILFTKFKK